MIFEHRSKNKKILLPIFVALSLMGVFLCLYSAVIFQEGNPWPQIKGILQLNLRSQDLVKISAEENKYISKSRDGAALVKAEMARRGYDFTEQMGAAYLFESVAGERAVATHRFYSRYYSLWKITERLE